jgi:hypothetical protein
MSSANSVPSSTEHVWAGTPSNCPALPLRYVDLKKKPGRLYGANVRFGR